MSQEREQASGASEAGRTVRVSGWATRRLWLDLLFLAVGLVAGFAGLSELFLGGPGGRAPRVALERSAGWHAPRASVFLDTPTLAHAGMLLGGVICLGGSLAAISRRARGRAPAGWPRWCQWAGGALAVVMYVVAVADIMSSAGGFG